MSLLSWTCCSYVPTNMLGQLLNAGSQQVLTLPEAAGIREGQGLGSLSAEGEWKLATEPLPSTQSRPGSRASRSAELRWRREHQDVLRAYAGQWVVLEGDWLAAHGESLEEIVRKANQLGILVPYVFRAEALPAEIVTIGL